MEKENQSRPPNRWLSEVAMLEAKRQALAEWRHIDLTESEGARKSSVKEVKNVLEHVVKGIGLDRKRSDLEILKVWNHILNPTVVAHAQPTGIRNGTLFVTVDSNVWLNEIVRYHRREILIRLQSSFGKDMITKISFRV